MIISLSQELMIKIFILFLPNLPFAPVASEIWFTGFGVGKETAGRAESGASEIAETENKKPQPDAEHGRKRLLVATLPPTFCAG